MMVAKSYGEKENERLDFSLAFARMQ